MKRCCECGQEHDGHAALCDECASKDVTSACGPGEAVEWAICPLCGGSGRCFYCSPLGPCYHCSGSGREQVGSMEECHVCGGLGDLGKGCEFCGYTRRCAHCGGTGRVPASVVRGSAPTPVQGGESASGRSGAKRAGKAVEGAKGARGAKGSKVARGSKVASGTKATKGARPTKGPGRAARGTKARKA